MIFRKDFEYTDDAYDASLEITEKKIYRKINIITMAVMVIFTLIMILISFMSEQYFLLIAGILFILIGCASYVLRSADLRNFISEYSPEAWEEKYEKTYTITLNDDKISVDLYLNGEDDAFDIFSSENNDMLSEPLSEQTEPPTDDGFDDIEDTEQTTDENADEDEEAVFTIGENMNEVFDIMSEESEPEQKEESEEPEQEPSVGGRRYSFDYDPHTCKCYESDRAFLIFSKTYDCMPMLKEQLTDEEQWVVRSYFSERMGKKYITV